jgi:Carboxypeptidase regulatory-like domain/TonB-dependent Receptor Plug Domain
MSSMARHRVACQRPGSRRALWRLPVALAIAVPTVPPLSAQVIRGRVIEAGTEKPVPGARVTAHLVEDTTGRLAVTDDEGRFELRLRVPGAYLVDVARLGYRPQHRGPLDLRRGQVISFDVVLPVVPLTLDPVTVQAQVNATMLQQVGFYGRMRSDFGHFITRDQIEARRARRASDLLGVIPGVSVLPDRRSPGQVRVQMRGSRLAEGGMCSPRVFVDGLVAIRGDARPPGPTGDQQNNEEQRSLGDDPRSPEPELDDVVRPDDIEAIEVYRSASQVPAEFGGASMFTRCGVIVIWTRRGK